MGYGFCGKKEWDAGKANMVVAGKNKAENMQRGHLPPPVKKDTTIN